MSFLLKKEEDFFESQFLLSSKILNWYCFQIGFVVGWTRWRRIFQFWVEDNWDCLSEGGSLLCFFAGSYRPDWRFLAALRRKVTVNVSMFLCCRSLVSQTLMYIYKFKPDIASLVKIFANNWLMLAERTHLLFPRFHL